MADPKPPSGVDQIYDTPLGVDLYHNSMEFNQINHN